MGESNIKRIIVPEQLRLSGQGPRVFKVHLEEIYLIQDGGILANKKDSVYFRHI